MGRRKREYKRKSRRQEEEIEEETVKDISSGDKAGTLKAKLIRFWWSEVKGQGFQQTTRAHMIILIDVCQEAVKFKASLQRRPKNCNLPLAGSVSADIKFQVTLAAPCEEKKNT